jgi:hypothetical protein
MPKAVVKEGKVVSTSGKFYVVVDRSRTQIPPEFADAAGLKRISAGGTVPVTFFGKTIVAIGRRPFILCYVPAPDIFKIVQPDLQKFLEKKYKDAGILAG